MELGVFLVFLVGFLVCAGLVAFFSVFGTRGETFEEAVEKQRNQNKEKKKEKKVTVEKKKKPKKGKENKNNGQEEDEVVVDAGEVVEPVYVEPVPEPVKEVIKPKKKEKKREEKKEVKEEKKEVKEEKKVEVEIKIVEPIIEEKIIQTPAPVIEAAPVVKEAPVSAAPKETAPVAAPKTEKKKIEIIEVEEEKENDEKKKKKSAKEKTKKTKSHYEEILEVIRKSPLSDSEAQSVVDLLLLKQTGKEDNGSDWIEPGKENESKKQARQLSELQVELEEEKSKSGSLEKKLSLLRKELNEGKATQAGHKRELDELSTKKNQEIASLNSRLQQVTGQINTALAQNKQLETNQGHYQTTITNLQAQLTQSGSGSDPKLAADLEKLAAARDALVQANTSLEQKLAGKAADYEQLTAANKQLTAAQQQLESRTLDLTEQLKKAAEENEKLKQADDQLSGSKQQLDSQLSAANNAKQQFDSQLAAVTAAKQQLQLELSVLKDKMAGKEGENVRLMEENERLSEQVASSVERPAAEGEEASKVNGHAEVEVIKMKEEDVWEMKYNKLSLDFEKITSKQKDLELELESTKKEISTLQSKNNVKDSELNELQTTTVDVFSRLFPSLPAGSKDLKVIEKGALGCIKKLTEDAAASSKQDNFTQEIAKLEAQVSNYKTVLAQTESMLTSLQASVETAEGEWKKKLETVEKEGGKYKESMEELKSKNSDLQKELDTTTKHLKDLEGVKESYAEEKNVSTKLAKKCAELQELAAAAQQQINNHTNEEERVSNGSVEA